ncbi:MAG: ATP-dependent protease ATPase subunit HslU [Pseudomonadota bacterium]|jgi:ATP-dependent HslUV protease ATP-binding subunit HslU
MPQTKTYLKMKKNSSDLIDTPTDIIQVSELKMKDANFSKDLNQANTNSDIPMDLEYLSKIDLTPKQIVLELDRYTIGQNDAKRAIAIALRNRKRRMLLDPELRDEVTPKNILMIGPSGVGKTEIGRRAAKITGCPFLKIEATKFTEVGYIGRDVDSIPRDLVDSAFKSLREEEITRLQPQVLESAENKIIDSFVPPSRSTTNENTDELKNKEKSIARNVFRKQLREGLLDDKEIDVELAALPAGVEIGRDHGSSWYGRHDQSIAKYAAKYWYYTYA